MNNTSIFLTTEQLPDCEEKVLSVIWDSPEELALLDIMETVNKKYGKEWKPQTVSTFLTRLCKKGYIHFYRKGRYCYYLADMSRNEYVSRELARMAYKFADGSLEKLIECAMSCEKNQ